MYAMDGRLCDVLYLFSVAAVASQILLDGIFAIEQRYIVFREAEHKMDVRTCPVYVEPMKGVAPPNLMDGMV